MTPHRSTPPVISDEQLAAQITAALHSHDLPPASVGAATDRIAARVTGAAAPHGPLRALPASRVGRVAAAGLVTSTLAVLGAGVAAAANPYTQFAEAVEDAARAVGITWSVMPDGYTREQYEAFWGAGYTTDDVAALEDLWQTDTTTAKARAGQLVLDGLLVPITPGSAGPGDQSPPDQWQAFVDSGYDPDDAELMAQLWQVDLVEAKVRIGQMAIDGDPLPVPPG